jgi:hypothetical protein
MFNESGNHPKEDLAKSGYQPDMKYKVFNHPFIYFLLHMKNQK